MMSTEDGRKKPHEGLALFGGSKPVSWLGRKRNDESHHPPGDNAKEWKNDDVDSWVFFGYGVPPFYGE